MKSAVKIFSVLFCTLAVMFSLSADELSNYTVLLDRLERNFWVAACASPNSIVRNNYQEYINNIAQSARKIDEFRRKNDSRLDYGDLKSPGKLLSGLLTSHSAFKKRLGFSGLHLTTMAEVKKVLRKNRNNHRQRTIDESNISIADYKKAIDFIRDENIETLTAKINSNGELRHYHRDVLLQTAQKFYTIISDARLTVFKLRKKDPLFQQKDSFSKNRRQQ